MQPKSKQILAENMNNPTLNKIYSSVNSFAIAVKGDRKIIRQYLNCTDKLYRKQWKLTVINKKKKYAFSFKKKNEKRYRHSRVI